MTTDSDKPSVPRSDNIQTAQDLDRRFLFEDDDTDTFLEEAPDIAHLLTDTIDTTDADNAAKPQTVKPEEASEAVKTATKTVPVSETPAGETVLPEKAAEGQSFPVSDDARTATASPKISPVVPADRPAETVSPKAGSAVRLTRVGRVDPTSPSARKVTMPPPAAQSDNGQNIYRLIDDEDTSYPAPPAVSQPTTYPAAAGTAVRLPSTEPVTRRPRKRRWPWIVSGTAAFCVFLYCFVCFFPTPFVKKWRNIWIETAMSTMTHQWLATAFFPESLINDILTSRYELEASQQGMSADKGLVSSTSAANLGTLRNAETQNGSADNASDAQDGARSSTQITKTENNNSSQWLNPDHPLYLAYPEIDMESFYEYAQEHEDDMYDEDGYLVIDEADRDSKGTCIKTTNGDTVKVLDTRNGIIVAAVSGDGFKGLIAIIRDPAQVGLAISSNFGEAGQRIPSICKKNDAILGINASGFEDPDGTGNGGKAYGYVLSDGKQYNAPERSDWFIMGFDEDNIFSVCNTGKFSSKSSNLRDAMEFQPLLINNGKIVCTENDGYGINPRAALGQCADGSVLMVVIDGRSASSLGCRGIDLAEIFYDYHAVQAANVDGGSSAVMYYNGRVISNPSGQNKTEGRLLPDAWVVYKAD